MFSTLLEICRTKYYCMEPTFFDKIKVAVMHNIVNHVAVPETEEKKLSAHIAVKNGEAGRFNANSWVGRADRISSYAEEGDDIVNLVRLNGAMSRGGDDCTYGSMDLRDLLMEAADIPQVKAHIIYTNTPGGSADCLQDFRKAINYCHEKGQKVYMFVDGYSASCGAFLGCMCDGIYAFNEADEIGSLGCYMAGFSFKDGDRNTITQETYHELYATRSVDKNKTVRDMANGDYDDPQKELDEFLDSILANAKNDRPSLLDEQMTGKMYRMGSVVGSLVDGICTVEDLAVMAVQEYDGRKGATLPPKEEAAAADGCETASSQSETNNVDGEKATHQTETTNQPQTNMKEYKHINEALSVDELGCNEQHEVFLNEEQLERLNEFLGVASERESEVSSLMEAAASAKQQFATDTEALNAQIAELKGKLDAALQDAEEKAQQIASLQATVDAASDTAKADLEAAETSYQATIDELKTKGDTVAAEAEQLRSEAAEKDQLIADLQSRVAELEESPNSLKRTSPKGNGAAPASAAVAVNPYQWDPTKSATENAKAREAYNAKLREAANAAALANRK